jgi:hypothetical protein
MGALEIVEQVVAVMVPPHWWRYGGAGTGWPQMVGATSSQLQRFVCASPRSWRCRCS